jgi:hypothetical protein
MSKNAASMAMELAKSVREASAQSEWRLVTDQPDVRVWSGSGEDIRSPALEHEILESLLTETKVL